MLQLLLDLRLTPWEELVDRLLRLCPRKTGNHLPKGLDSVRLGCRRSVFEDELEDEIEEGVGQVEANNVKSVLERAEDTLFLFSSRRVLLTSLFG